MKPLYQLKPLKKALFLSTLTFSSLIAVSNSYAALTGSAVPIGPVAVGGTRSFSAQMVDGGAAFEPTGTIDYTITAIDGNPVAPIALCSDPLADDGIPNFTSATAACDDVSMSQVGVLQITASYSGDVNLAPESAVIGNVTVEKSAAAITAEPSGSMVSPGQVIQISTSIDGYQPGGTVSLQIGDTVSTVPVVTNGNNATATASIMIPSGIVGDIYVFINYSGDSNNSPSSTVKILSLASGTNQFVLLAPSSSGPSTQPLTLTFNAPSDMVSLTGGVQFTDNGMVIPGCESLPIMAGKAECTLKVPSGDHTFIATYSGGDIGVRSAQTTYRSIGKKASTTTATASLLPQTKKIHVEVEVYDSSLRNSIKKDTAVVGYPTGDVNVSVRDYRCTATLVQGKGSCDIPANLSMSSVMETDYAGDDDYDPSDTLITIGDSMGFPENGWYYAPSQPNNGLPPTNGPGVGYFIDSRVSGDIIKFSMAIQTYRASDGSAYWYLATGVWNKLSNGWSVAAPIGEYCCGSDIYKPYQGFALRGSAGTASLVFKNTRQATLNLSMPQGSEEVAIDKFVIGDPSNRLNPALPETGLYLIKGEEGTGLAAEFRNQETFTTYFGYKDKDPIWYLTSGPSGFPSLYTGNWMQYRNGKPIGDHPYRAPELVPGKVADVTFQYVSPLYFMMIDPSGKSKQMDRYEW